MGPRPTDVGEPARGTAVPRRNDKIPYRDHIWLLWGNPSRGPPSHVVSIRSVIVITTDKCGGILTGTATSCRLKTIPCHHGQKMWRVHQGNHRTVPSPTNLAYPKFQPSLTLRESLRGDVGEPIQGTDVSTLYNKTCRRVTNNIGGNASHNRRVVSLRYQTVHSLIITGTGFPVKEVIRCNAAE